MYTGPHLIKDNLVFGYDTGHPAVSANHELYKFNKGEPTTTFDVGDMTPSSPDSSFTSNAVYHYNMHGTVWDWTYYPNSNISDDGGMEWHPEVKGPGFKGAWLMKKRPGGNSESNFSGTPPGALDETSPYTVSVWCKTSQASCFRIHINTTKNGSSYWGYASGYHSGGGDWERLSVTLPANTGNTNMGVIRCQALGTTTTADAYFRNYQVEKNTQPTPFLLGGTRSSTQSLIDLKRTTDIDLSNVSFDSNAQMIFDGTDDRIELGDQFDIADYFIDNQSFTIEAVVNLLNTDTNSNGGIFSNQKFQSQTDAPGFGLCIRRANNTLYYCMNIVEVDNSIQTSYEALAQVAANIGNLEHVTYVYDNNTSTIYAYINGELANSQTNSNFNWSLPTDTTRTKIGTSTQGGWGYYHEMDLPVVKCYNKALTSAEVSQNYNALKNRFSL